MIMNNLILEVDNSIAVLTINRPKALNALNSETLVELNEVLTEIEGRSDIKVVILTGAGEKSFVAGADISEMVNFTGAEGRAFGMRAAEPFFKLMNMRQVTIAAVNGFALGGGCEISMACDIRIASDNATFGQPECGLGIIPGFGGTQRLARLVGMGRAKAFNEPPLSDMCISVILCNVMKTGAKIEFIATDTQKATSTLPHVRLPAKSAPALPYPIYSKNAGTPLENIIMAIFIPMPSIPHTIIFGTTPNPGGQ